MQVARRKEQGVGENGARIEPLCLPTRERALHGTMPDGGGRRAEVHVLVEQARHGGSGSDHFNRGGLKDVAYHLQIRNALEVQRMPRRGGPHTIVPESQPRANKQMHCLTVHIGS